MKTLKNILKVIGIILLAAIGLFSVFLVLLKMEVIGFVPDKIPNTKSENYFLDSLKKNNEKYYKEVFKETIFKQYLKKYNTEYTIYIILYGFPTEQNELELSKNRENLKNNAKNIAKALYQQVNQRDTTYYTKYSIIFRGKDDIKFTYRVKELE